MGHRGQEPSFSDRLTFPEATLLKVKSTTRILEGGLHPGAISADNRGTFARYCVPDNINEVVAGSRTSCLSKLAGKRSASPGKPANSIAWHVARSPRGGDGGGRARNR